MRYISYYILMTPIFVQYSVTFMSEKWRYSSYQKYSRYTVEILRLIMVSVRLSEPYIRAKFMDLLCCRRRR